MRVNVLALVTDAWNGRGGIAQYNRDLLGALAADPEIASIQVLARHTPDAGEELPDKVVMPGALGKVGFVLAALRAAAKLQRPFIIFCGHINFVPLAGLLGRLRGAPVWLQVHGIEAWQRPSRHRARAVERVHLITAVSRYTRSRLLSWVRLSPASVKVLPNTVSERFAPGPKSRELLARYGLGGKKVLLTVSRLAGREQYKGHDRVIQALPALLSGCPDICYLIVGDGDDRNRLELLARENGVSDKVIFAGAVPHLELPDYYRLADVFVMPSTGEGFGIAFLEAAASGVPVVGCGADGSRDALREGALGIIACPTITGLVEAVESALTFRPTGKFEGSCFRRANFNQRARLQFGLLTGRQP